MKNYHFTRTENSNKKSKKHKNYCRNEIIIYEKRRNIRYFIMTWRDSFSYFLCLVLHIYALAHFSFWYSAINFYASKYLHSILGIDMNHIQSIPFLRSLALALYRTIFLKIIQINRNHNQINYSPLNNKTPNHKSLPEKREKLLHNADCTQANIKY